MGNLEVRVSASQVGEAAMPAIPMHIVQASEGEGVCAVTEVVVAAVRRRIMTVEAVEVEKCIFVCMVCVFRCAGVEKRGVEKFRCCW